MYKLSKTIDGISNFIAFSNDLLHKNVGSLKGKSLFVNNTKIYNENVADFYIYNGMVFFSTWLSETYKYTISSNELTIVEYGALSVVRQGGYIIFNAGEISRLYNQLADKIEYDVENKLISLKSLIHQDEIYSFVDSNILAIKGGQVLWNYNINEAGGLYKTNSENNDLEVLQIIAVLDSILLALLADGKVIGLDRFTGKNIFELSNCDNTYCHNVQVPLQANGFNLQTQIRYYLDDKQSIIKGISYDSYCEISLIDKERHFEFWGLAEQLGEYGLKEISWDRSKFHNGCFYFFDSNAYKWGIFETLTKQFVWISDKIAGIVDTEEAWGQLKEIQVDGNKVYVLDSLNRLHVYEQ